MSKSTQRLDILDSFRAIAIIFVMLYHYFSRWIQQPKVEVSLYPYGSEYDYFGYGYYGVQFFFIISGFVIFSTLENTATITEFWKKRLIRLFPAMLIVSVFIYIFFVCCDNTMLFPNSHKFKNFLPSLTFINPEIFNFLLANREHEFEYLNGSFWSLWPEIQFYLFVSVLYFLNKELFVKRFIIISAVIILSHYAILNNSKFGINFSESFMEEYKYWFIGLFTLPANLVYFCIGVLFYLLYKNKMQLIKADYYIIVALIFFVLFRLYGSQNWQVGMIFLSMLLLFFLFIYTPSFLSFLDNKFIARIGMCSYFTYLIHENIGVLLINKYGIYFMPYGFILPIILVVFFILLSEVYTRKIDKRITQYLKVKILGGVKK